jgi:hypothetical protein
MFPWIVQIPFNFAELMGEFVQCFNLPFEIFMLVRWFRLMWSIS